MTSGKGFDDIHCQSGCLKENIKLEKCKTGKFKDLTPLGTDKSGLSKENIKIKKCETENFKEITPYRTNKSNQSNVINSDTFLTTNVPRQQETLLNQNGWESLINEVHEIKPGKVQLPSRWAGIFTEAMKELNQYCNLNVTRHYIYGKGNKIMRADYIEGCKLKGTCELYSNMVLKICNDVNEIKHSKEKLKSFQSRYIMTPHLENAPGKEWLRNLKNILSEQFDAGNLGNSGQSKQVFRQLLHEGKLKKRLNKDPIQGMRKLISKFQDDCPRQSSS